MTVILWFVAVIRRKKLASLAQLIGVRLSVHTAVVVVVVFSLNFELEVEMEEGKL